MSGVDPGGLLTGGTPGFVKRCPLSVSGLPVPSGVRLGPLAPLALALCLLAASSCLPHVASGPFPLSFGDGLASPLPQFHGPHWAGVCLVGPPSAVQAAGDQLHETQMGAPAWTWNCSQVAGPLGAEQLSAAWGGPVSQTHALGRQVSALARRSGLRTQFVLQCGLGPRWSDLAALAGYTAMCRLCRSEGQAGAAPSSPHTLLANSHCA